jgi:type IV secretory pathway TrbD component
METTANDESRADDSQNADILKRDYLIFGIALTVISVGLADGLYRGFGLPLWAAAPLGVLFWGAAETLVYRKYKHLRDKAAD